MQHDIRFPVLQFAAEKVSTVGCSDIGGKGDNVWNGLNWDQVNT